MNARLQVEHPVTEMVTGLDLVRQQVLVALGERVELAPEPRGHAIECRLNAEDPHRDFLPGPGLVTHYRPPGGPFVRLDSGVEEGRRVAGDYDSLFAKLIVWAEDRDRARARMLRALDETEIEGIPTTIPFHRWVLETDEFRTGRIHTKWVEEALAEGALKPPADQVATARTGASADGVIRPARLLVEVAGHRIPVTVWGDEVRTPPAPPETHIHGHVAGAGDTLVAPMQGTILDVTVEPGQEVESGQTVCILEAMKMENHIVATREGTVTHVSVSKGDVVETGQPIAVIE
jgi:acetyl-CoA/propionyl-CoA carboxylase biotin carboxyl carrier protein